VSNRPAASASPSAPALDPARRALPRGQLGAAPGTITVVERFFDRAARDPERVAITAGGRAWTYAELAASTAALAGSIPRLDAVPVLAIHGAPSFGFITALMAVMRAGAAALPIDATLPPLRKRQMLDVAGAAGVLDVGGRIDPDLLTTERAWAIDETTGRGPVGHIEPGAGGLPRATRGDAAYLFLTSGTTGAPKAVLGRASSLDHFVGWQRERFAVGAEDRVGQFTNLSFDPCLREIFVALTSGASLQIPPPGARLSGERVFAFMAAAGVSVAHLVPSLARHWLRGADAVPDGLRTLRLTLFAGEPLARDLVAAWRALAPSTVVGNLYGPTETTLARFHWQVPDGDALAAYPDPLPVGQPIDDTAAIVLAGDGRRAAAGSVGEIFIDTAFPSYGYLDEGTNQEKFVAVDGIEPRHGTSLFRTGDLGYQDDRGDLVVVGRVDSQIKIGGVRINPNEVAACLRAVPGVVDAVVAPTTDDRGTVLVAWYVPADRAIEPTVLRRYLGQRLVPAMVPSELIATDALPVTANGKVDMPALRRLCAAPGTPEASPGPPTPHQDLVRATWAQAFGLPAVASDEDFYRLGGDSLKATEIAARLARETALALDAQAVFDYPTPRRLAEALASGTFARLPSTPSPARARRQTPRTVPLSPRQRAYRVVCMAEGTASWCTLSRAVPLPGPLDSGSLTRAVARLLERHDALRMQFPALEARDALEILVPADCAPAAVPVRSVDLTAHGYASSQDRIMELRAEGSRLPFDVARWPLFRLGHLRFADREVLMIWAHHLIVDGPSLNRVLDELLQALDGRPGPLERTAEDADYADYIEHCAAADPPTRERDAGYWRSLLHGAPVTTLPEARRSPGSALGMLFTQPFPPDLVGALLASSRARGCTPFVMLLGAFLRCAARYADRSDLSAIIPIQVRPTAAFARTVGLFFSQLVVRIDAARIVPSSNAWTRELAMQLREGHRHAAYEFDRRLEDLGLPSRQYDYPLTTLMFNLNQVSPAHTFAAATPFGHHRLGRALRFQLQGEVQQQGDEYLISYLYRAGVFGTDGIERFAAEVIDAAAALAAAGDSLS